MTKQHHETIRQYCTRDPDNVVLPDLPTSCNGAEDHSDDEEAEDKWDLIEVIDLKELKKKKPKPCAEDGCSSGKYILFSWARSIQLNNRVFILFVQRRAVSGHPNRTSGMVALIAWKSKFVSLCKLLRLSFIGNTCCRPDAIPCFISLATMEDGLLLMRCQSNI